MTGELGTPLATAVTCAIPDGPGVQTLGAVRESQVPAQASPVLATVTMFGAVDWNEKVSMTGLPDPFSAVAKKLTVLPTSSDTLGLGVRVTIAGTTSLVTWVTLELLQDIRREQLSSPNNAAEERKASLPMNAFQKGNRTS